MIIKGYRVRICTECKRPFVIPRNRTQVLCERHLEISTLWDEINLMKEEMEQLKKKKK